MFDIRDEESRYGKEIQKKQYIEVMCVVHENDMMTEYGIERTDLLSFLVRDLLCWSNALGFHIELEEDRPYILDNDYYSRRMRFLIDAPNVVNGHMGMINKYDQFKF